MKDFVHPNIEVFETSIEDIITTSNGNSGIGGGANTGGTGGDNPFGPQ